MQSEERITNMLHENKRFKDVRSEVKRDMELVPHLKLFGEDMSEQRELVMRRAKGRCEYRNEAGKRCPVRDNLEMDHVQGGLVGRCDCLHNLQMLCPRCHQAKHGRTVRFGPDRPQAEQEFIDICEKEDRQ